MGSFDRAGDAPAEAATVEHAGELVAADGVDRVVAGERPERRGGTGPPHVEVPGSRERPGRDHEHL